MISRAQNGDKTFHFCKVNDKHSQKVAPNSGDVPEKKPGDFTMKCNRSNISPPENVDILGDDSLIYGDFPWRPCILNPLFFFGGDGQCWISGCQRQTKPRFNFQSRRRSEGKLRP